jgi:hypothetical protein
MVQKKREPMEDDTEDFFARYELSIDKMGEFADK